MFCLAVTVSCSIVIFIVEMQIAFSWKCCCVALCQYGVWINTMIWQTSICQIKCQIWPSFFLSLCVCVCVCVCVFGRSLMGEVPEAALTVMTEAFRDQWVSPHFLSFCWNSLPLESLGSVRFVLNTLIILFSNDILNLSKVTVNNYIFTKQKLF